MELKDTINGMISDDYEKRFIAEYQQVKIRLEKLNTMLDRLKKGELDFTPKCKYNTLARQAIIMQSYKQILIERAIEEGIDYIIDEVENA